MSRITHIQEALENQALVEATNEYKAKFEGL